MYAHTYHPLYDYLPSLHTHTHLTSSLEAKNEKQLLTSASLCLPHSTIPPILQIPLRHDRLDAALARHQRAALPAAILVRQDAHVLAAARLGAGLRRVAAGVSASADGQRQRAGVVRRLLERDRDRFGRAGVWVAARGAVESGGEEGEGRGWRWGQVEVAIGRRRRKTYENSVGWHRLVTRTVVCLSSLFLIFLTQSRSWLALRICNTK